jgi:hypothetical protein
MAFSIVDWWCVDRGLDLALTSHYGIGIGRSGASKPHWNLLAAQPSIPRDRGCSVSHPLQEELMLLIVLIILVIVFGGGGYYMGPGVGYYGGGGISFILLIVILYLLVRGDRTRV